MQEMRKTRRGARQGAGDFPLTAWADKRLARYPGLARYPDPYGGGAFRVERHIAETLGASGGFNRNKPSGRSATRPPRIPGRIC
jgi:hypothetical protein